MFGLVKQRLKREKGFTLVELLAVIAILGIIVAIAVPTIGGVIAGAEKDADTASKELIENAARLADVSSDGEQTSYDIDKLIKDGYLEDIPEGFNGSDEVTKSGNKWTFVRNDDENDNNGNDGNGKNHEKDN